MTVDANGNVLTATHDLGADGTFEYVETFTYDANGKEIRFERDGVFQLNQIFAEHIAIEPADGVPDEVRVTFRDAAGLEIGAESDGYEGPAGWVKADGTPDRVQRNVTYDANGNVISYEEDGYVHVSTGRLVAPADGTFARHTAEYDASGNVTREGYDGDNDGIADITST